MQVIKHLSRDTFKHVMCESIDLMLAVTCKPPVSDGPVCLGLVETKPNPKRNALVAYVDALPAEERAELMAMMWIGRADGGYYPNQYDLAVKDAKSVDHAGNYMVGKWPLAQYLMSGYDLLGCPPLVDTWLVDRKAPTTTETDDRIPCENTPL